MNIYLKAYPSYIMYLEHILWLTYSPSHMPPNPDVEALTPSVILSGCGFVGTWLSHGGRVLTFGIYGLMKEVSEN